MEAAKETPRSHQETKRPAEDQQDTVQGTARDQQKTIRRPPGHARDSRTAPADHLNPRTSSESSTDNRTGQNYALHHSGRRTWHASCVFLCKCIKIGMRRDRMCSIIMLGIFGANFSAGAEQGCQSVLFPLQERTPQCDQELLGEPILEASSDNQCSKLELKRLAITNKG